MLFPSAFFFAERACASTLPTLGLGGIRADILAVDLCGGLGRVVLVQPRETAVVRRWG